MVRMVTDPTLEANHSDDHNIRRIAQQEDFSDDGSFLLDLTEDLNLVCDRIKVFAPTPTTSEHEESLTMDFMDSMFCSDDNENVNQHVGEPTQEVKEKCNSNQQKHCQQLVSCPPNTTTYSQQELQMEHALPHIHQANHSIPSSPITGDDTNTMEDEESIVFNKSIATLRSSDIFNITVQSSSLGTDFIPSSPISLPSFRDFYGGDELSHKSSQNENYDSDVTEIPCVNNLRINRKEIKQTKLKRTNKKIQKKTVIELSESEKSDNEGSENNEILKTNCPNRSPRITEQDKEHFGDASKWKGVTNANFLVKNKRIYGHVEGVLTTYDKRIDCSQSKTHRPPQCGIFGNGNNDEAAESICASSMGGYGDEDYGDILIYTGQGGSETQDQKLNSVNKSLTLNMTKKIPVRVVRGYQLQTKYAPKSGYRYDGLYWVTNYWKEKQVLKNGTLGAKVFKFRLVRLDGQPPIPVQKDFKNTNTKVEKVTRAQYLKTSSKSFSNSSKSSRSDNPSTNSERGKRRGHKRKAREIKVKLEESNISEENSGIQDSDEIEEHCILSRQMKGKGNSFLKTPLKNNDQYYYFREREQAITTYSQQYGHVTSQYDRAHLFKHLNPIRFINNTVMRNVHRNMKDSEVTHSNLSSPQQSLIHWHGSSSEFTEIPLFFRNEPDGVFMETPEQQLRYVYKYGRSIGNNFNIFDNIESVVNTMITQPADRENEGNLSNQLITSDNIENTNVFSSEDITNKETASSSEKDEIIFRPFKILKRYDNLGNGSIISTSYMLSEINTKDFLEILCARSFGKRQLRSELEYQDLLLLIEKFLMREREILQLEISPSTSTTILQARKKEHFNRISQVIEKL
ncbi:hypothetical protein C9374_008967 [Naegleria lovaniensis]|uniref:YDG domain-containing protein n=1 Tax=Naegleria lovaniensis TaxID=51637 RepID=A0AA88GIB1_NAELO|nr:uncharacterized protein C9374_008967 [Naegleria lovaniensis]KAG2377882.1 hypothetical protein C9374_008967 [Naegleria lovaniensis]